MKTIKTPAADLPTVLVVLLCYTGYAVATTLVAETSLMLAVLVLIPIITLHSSLQHEVLHGHLFNARPLAVLAIYPALGCFVPYERFRDTHLEHHIDTNLTDPYDDPESNFMHPMEWQNLGMVSRLLLDFNNTLFGRMLIGPAISLMRLYGEDAQAMLAGNRAIQRAYLHHLAGLALTFAWLEAVSPLPVTAYLLAAYAGFSILKVRTFLEHRAHEASGGRTVIVEDRGIFAFLFLNNNFHALHHEQPALKWYQLPEHYRADREAILSRNDHYVFRSYWQIFRCYFLKAKDQVPHPLR